MKYLAPLLIIIFAIPSISAANTMFMYKYINDNGGYTTLVSSQSEIRNNNSIGNIMIKKLINQKFDVALIPKKYYKVKTTYNIIIFGDRAIQYEIIPLDNNRFTRIVWVAGNGSILRNETINDVGKVVVEYGVISQDKHPIDKKQTSQLPVDRAKVQFYAGFYHTFTNVMRDGSIHLGFHDGVNNFSIFINPFVDEKPSIKKRVFYGNYVYSECLNGTEVTVLGSLPHDTMGKITGIITDNFDAVASTIEANDYITEALYNKMTIEFDGGTQ